MSSLGPYNGAGDDAHHQHADGDAVEDLLPAIEVHGLVHAGGGTLVPGAAEEPLLVEALKARQGQGHQPGGEHAHDEVAHNAHQQGKAEGEDRAGGGLAENDGQDIAGAKHAHEHDGHDSGGDVAVENGPEACLEALLQGAVQALAVAQLLTDTAGGDDVGIHAHADGEDDAGDAGQGHGKGVQVGEEAGHGGETQRHLARQADDSHHAGQPENHDHQNGDDNESDDGGHHHHVQGLRAQGGRQGLEVGGLQGEGQGAGLDLRGQLGGFLAGKVTGDGALPRR